MMNNLNHKIGIFMWYDNNIKDYAEINYKINKIYCDKYGYTLIKSNEKLHTKRKAHWERIPLLLQYFNDFDYLVWIDADAYFNIDSPPITNIIQEFPDKIFFFSEDRDCINTKFINQINTGVFIVKNCEQAKNILNTWGYDNDLFKLNNGKFGWNDQAILIDMYYKNIDNIIDVSHIIKYGVLQYFDKGFKLPSEKFGLNNQGFIFHMAGYSKNERITNSKEYHSNIYRTKYKQFISNKIQLDTNVIDDILINSENKKMLVFGLGYDSELWYNLTNKNTFFVEDNKTYIDLNKNIDSNNIIFHTYSNINVKNSLKLTNEQINNYVIPEKLIDNGPYDIILIDGPNGMNDGCPGRLLPIFWSKKYLSKKGTIIYVDDSSRNLERKCINKYFIGSPKYYFNYRLGTMKIIV